MTGLGFDVVDITPEPYAVAPTLVARIHITESSSVRVHAMALRAQVRIEPQRRRYTDSEADAVLDMFGSRDRWASTLKPFQWMQTSTLVQGFTGACDADVAMPCTYDFDVTASKYLHGLENGLVPLNFLFSGTVFTNVQDRFRVEQIPWNLECSYDLPVTVWRDLIHQHYPSTGWLRCSHDTISAIARFKAQHGLLGFDDALDRLVSKSEVM